MSLTLEKNIRATSQYKGKTKFAFFNSIIPGDSINVSLQVANPGGFGGRKFSIMGQRPRIQPKPAPQCKNPQCQKALDKQEIKRVYGQNSAVFQLGYCSARCFTKVATGQ